MSRYRNYQDWKGLTPKRLRPKPLRPKRPHRKVLFRLQVVRKSKFNQEKPLIFIRLFESLFSLTEPQLCSDMFMLQVD